jgi:hypothetical protein
MTNMKVFAASFVAEIFLAIALTCGQAFCADPFDVADVYLSCSCQDAMGANLCLALKEKIKRSSNLRLVATENHTGGVALHLVCAEGSASGFRTTGAHAVAAVVLTMFAGDQEYYESLEIMKVGPQQSDTLATSIMSQVEEMASRNFGSAAAPRE